MRFLRRLVVRAAQELAANPEPRAKASQVLEEEVKPRARKAWQDAQPEIKNVKKGLFGFARKVREEYRKGRDGDS